MSHGGKGSAPRPFSVDHSIYQNNWERIFRTTQDGINAYEQEIKQLSSAISEHSPASSANESRQPHQSGMSDSERWQHTIDGMEWYAQRFQQQL